MSEFKIIRHRLVDRLLHWFFGSAILVLLITGLLPPLGINFNWLEIHWITGILMVFLLIFHVIRSVLVRTIKPMLLSTRDFSLSQKPGKYTLAQKLMHHFISVLVFGGIVSGGLMLVRIDTPFWQRDPFWLNADTWGLVYFIHGLIALAFVSTLLLHVYFSIRPEKRLYLRSMIKGWISLDEFNREHDPQRWSVKNDEKK